jgi:hypothetical protein
MSPPRVTAKPKILTHLGWFSFAILRVAKLWVATLNNLLPKNGNDLLSF